MKYALLLLSLAISTCVMAQTATPTKQPTGWPITPVETKTADSTNKQVYSEKMPVPSADIRGFLAQNIVYPDSARKNKIHGKVTIQFAVNEDGTLGEFKAKRSLGYGCEEEAIRVLKTMPPWTPGLLNGTPVKVYYTQSINFEL